MATQAVPLGSTFTEQYSYLPAGAKTNKGVLITRTLHTSSASGPYTADLESSYTYDNEGRMLTEQYPGSTYGAAGPNLGYAYDSMGRLNTMTDLAASTSIISATTYDPASRLLSITGLYTEGRSYNVMGQLTGLGNNSVSIAYSYSATQNNGKITGQTDYMTGEQLVYTYDALNRLSSAATTSSSSTTWGQSYTFDGFGNLTNETTTAGQPSGLMASYSAANNRQGGECSDANGNINSASACNLTGVYGYDVENRIVSLASLNTQYAYAPGNKRVWRGTSTWDGGVFSLTLDELTFWSVTGQKLATYNISGDPSITYNPGAGNPPQVVVNIATTNYYFGRKLIRNGSLVTYVGSDRLGSIGKYYPWGQVKPTGNVVGTEGFTGYFRDSETLLDYAQNRYHQPGMGRFLTPDPYQQSAGPNDPGSWNRYAYVAGDPVNRTDRKGLYVDCDGNGDCDESDSGDCLSDPADCQGPGYATPPAGGDGGPCTSACNAIGVDANGNPVYSAEGTTPDTGTEVDDTPPPTDPSGNPLPPPIPLPPGRNGQPNQWVPVPGSGNRPIKWKPKNPIPNPKGGQPGASWDPNGHWDGDDGNGNRIRVNPGGQPVDHFGNPMPIAIGRIIVIIIEWAWPILVFP